MSIRPLLVVVAVTALAALPACGDGVRAASDAEVLGALERGGEEAVIAAIAEFGLRGRERPEEVTTLLVGSLRRHEANPDVHMWAFELADADGLDGGQIAEHLTASLRVMASRLQLFGYGEGRFTVQGNQLIVEYPRDRDAPPEKEATLVEELYERLTARGGFDLALVVTRPGRDDLPTSLWKGDAASYDAYVEAELEKLRADPTGYEPEKPRYRLVETADPEDDQTLLVLVPQHRMTRFDDRDMSLALNVTDHAWLELRSTGGPRREALASWAKEHRYRLVAIVIGGKAELVKQMVEPWAQNRLKLKVGDVSDLQAQAHVLMLRNYLQTKRHPRPLVGERVFRAVAPSDPPAARALAEIGPSADPHLRPLAVDRKIGASIRWALNEIQRRAAALEQEGDAPQ